MNWDESCSQRLWSLPITINTKILLVQLCLIGTAVCWGQGRAVLPQWEFWEGLSLKESLVHRRTSLAEPVLYAPLCTSCLHYPGQAVVLLPIGGLAGSCTHTHGSATVPCCCTWVKMWGSFLASYLPFVVPRSSKTQTSLKCITAKPYSL